MTTTFLGSAIHSFLAAALVVAVVVVVVVVAVVVVVVPRLVFAFCHSDSGWCGYPRAVAATDEISKPC
jgi:type II secretory pathway component PulF